MVSDGVDAVSAEKPTTSSPKPDAETHDAAAIMNKAGNETHDAITTDARDDEAAPEQSDDDELGPIHDRDQPAARPRPAPKPAKSSIIERFAKTQGFRKDSDNRFFHEDGSWIGRTNGSGFPWERRTGTGDLVRYYWTKDHCLDREPLQIEADIWGMLDSHPEIYALILVNTEEEPAEVTGAHLRAMRDEGTITLYPATYRLVSTNDDHA